MNHKIRWNEIRSAKCLQINMGISSTAKVFFFFILLPLSNKKHIRVYLAQNAIRSILYYLCWQQIKPYILIVFRFIYSNEYQFPIQLVNHNKLNSIRNDESVNVMQFTLPVTMTMTLIHWFEQCNVFLKWH